VVIVVVAVVVIAVLWSIGTVNSFVRLQNYVAESWKQVDVELQRRHDLVPALVSTVKQAAAYERSTLEAVVAARESAVGARTASADVATVSAAEGALTAELRKLRALVENYPQLQAVANYDRLHRDLADTEDRIAASRRIYNANVRALNTKIETVPASLVASARHVRPATYFEMSGPGVRDALDVDRLFGGTGTQG
jgi:LemA protein